jgi:hypothetical protein
LDLALGLGVAVAVVEVGAFDTVGRNVRSSKVGNDDTVGAKVKMVVGDEDFVGAKVCNDVGAPVGVSTTWALTLKTPIDQAMIIACA